MAYFAVTITSKFQQTMTTDYPVITWPMMSRDPKWSKS